MGGIAGKYMSRVASGVNIADGVATIASADVLSFKIIAGATTGKYAFQLGEGSYLSCTSTANNNLATATSLTAKCDLDIAVTNGVAVIKCAGTSSTAINKLQYNSNVNQERFSNYRTGTQKDCKLYKKTDGGSAPPVDPVDPTPGTIGQVTVSAGGTALTDDELENGIEVLKGTEITFACENKDALLTMTEEYGASESYDVVDQALPYTFIVNEEIWLEYLITLPGTDESVEGILVVTIKEEEPVDPNAPVTLTWTLDGTYSKIANTYNATLGQTAESANGCWMLVGLADGQYLSKMYGGLQVGKKDEPFTGSVILTGADIPENAVITSAGMKVRYASNATNYVWNVVVDGQTSKNSITVNSDVNQMLVTITDVNLEGNNIEFVSSTQANGIIFQGFEIQYYVPEKAPELPVVTGTEIGEEHLIITGAAGTTIYYKSEEWGDAANKVAARAAEASGVDLSEFTKNPDEENTHILSLSKAEHSQRLITYLAVSPSGLQSEVAQHGIYADGSTTGIDGVEADDASAAVEWFNLQGVRVANPTQGLFIRRQGSRVEKVVVK